MNSTNSQLPIIGWREWVKLPDFEVARIKAKVDSGARSSSIHTTEMEIFEKDGREWVRFIILPHQKNDDKTYEAEAAVLEMRNVKSSNGEVTLRPVIVANLQILGQVFPIEMTLANRYDMGFRMLLGREAFRGRFLVDAGRSYLGGRPKRKKKRPQ